MTEEMRELADSMEGIQELGGRFDDSLIKSVIAALRSAAAQAVLPAQGEPVAGEAIFQECAEIALEHIMGDIISDRPGYDEACREIADAIRLRASNRKTMDAIANAWPIGCHSPISCSRNGCCMYVGCKHDGADIRALAVAALLKP